FLALTGLPWTGFWGETVNQWITDIGLGAPAPPANIASAGMGDMPGMDTGTDGPDVIGDRDDFATTQMPDMPGMDMAPAGPAPRTTGEALSKVGWTVEYTPLPRIAPGPLALGFDHAVELVRPHGMPAGFELAVPVGPYGVYTAACFPDDLTRERVLNFDPH